MTFIKLNRTIIPIEFVLFVFTLYKLNTLETPSYFFSMVYSCSLLFFILSLLIQYLFKDKKTDKNKKIEKGLSPSLKNSSFDHNDSFAYVLESIYINQSNHLTSTEEYALETALESATNFSFTTETNNRITEILNLTNGHRAYIEVRDGEMIGINNFGSAKFSAIQIFSTKDLLQLF